MLRFLPFFLLATTCAPTTTDTQTESNTNRIYQVKSTSLIVLGNVQDAGSPHIGCAKDCCSALFRTPDHTRMVVSLGIVDPEYGKKFLFDASPDFPSQTHFLKEYHGAEASEIPDGIFLTHAHIGHYAGLMYLGREAMNANNVKVYAMPRMNEFLTANGPWSQLVTLQNIQLQPIQNNDTIDLTPNIKVIPMLVPHRDEYSETVGYKVIGPNKSILFIPDIDKWEKWELSISKEIQSVDYAFLDATFFDGNEIGHRDIADIPHPFVVESLKLFETLSMKDKKKVYFIHFNHTNPLLNPASDESKRVLSSGFNIARFGDLVDL